MSDSYDNFICDSCEAVFGVITNIQAGGRIVRTLDPTRTLFTGKCPACGCTHLSLDPAFDEDNPYAYTFNDEGIPVVKKEL